MASTNKLFEKDTNNEYYLDKFCYKNQILQKKVYQKTRIRKEKEGQNNKQTKITITSNTWGMMNGWFVCSGCCVLIMMNVSSIPNITNYFMKQTKIDTNRLSLTRHHLSFYVVRRTKRSEKYHPWGKVLLGVVNKIVYNNI